MVVRAARQSTQGTTVGACGSAEDPSVVIRGLGVALSPDARSGEGVKTRRKAPNERTEMIGRAIKLAIISAFLGALAVPAGALASSSQALATGSGSIGGEARPSKKGYLEVLAECSKNELPGQRQQGKGKHKRLGWECVKVPITLRGWATVEAHYIPSAPFAECSSDFEDYREETAVTLKRKPFHRNWNSGEEVKYHLYRPANMLWTYSSLFNTCTAGGVTWINRPVEGELVNPLSSEFSNLNYFPPDGSYKFGLYPSYAPHPYVSEHSNGVITENEEGPSPFPAASFTTHTSQSAARMTGLELLIGPPCNFVSASGCGKGTWEKIKWNFIAASPLRPTRPGTFAPSTDRDEK